MSAILIGSISTVADTSERQREAFNAAFAEHGLDWTWDRDEYVRMLSSSGGAQRIADYAAARGEAVDADAVHATKSELFRDGVAGSGLSARPGVAQTIRAARDAGIKVALVTTTSPDNVATLLDALPDVARDEFDLVVDATQVDTPKPDAAAYDYALRTLGERPENCVAVEDNVGGVAAANAAGLRCVAFPNENTAAHDFAPAAETVDQLEFDRLSSYIQAR